MGGEPWTEFYELDDNGWEIPKAFLPANMVEDRGIISGILWVYTTRKRWQDLPERFGKFNTARNRSTKLRSLELWEPFIAKAKENAAIAIVSMMLATREAQSRGHPQIIDLFSTSWNFTS